jgi:hypothetical protein
MPYDGPATTSPHLRAPGGCGRRPGRTQAPASRAAGELEAEESGLVAKIDALRNELRDLAAKAEAL